MIAPSSARFCRPWITFLDDSVLPLFVRFDLQLPRLLRPWAGVSLTLSPPPTSWSHPVVSVFFSCLFLFLRRKSGPTLVQHSSEKQQVSVSDSDRGWGPTARRSRNCACESCSANPPRNTNPNIPRLAEAPKSARHGRTFSAVVYPRGRTGAPGRFWQKFDSRSVSSP